MQHRPVISRLNDKIMRFSKDEKENKINNKFTIHFIYHHYITKYEQQIK